MLLKSYPVKLDKHGVAIVEGVQFHGTVQPVVTVEHGGVLFHATGRPMSAAQPDQVVRVNVYDTTQDAPAWTIRMRHLFTSLTPAGLEVNEMIVIDNPADRAWIGEGEAPSEGEAPAEPRADGGAAAATRTTVTLPLPAGATGAKVMRLQGVAAIAGGVLVMQSALVPGTTELHVSYVIPITKGQAALTIAAPVSTQHLMLFVPQDAGAVKAQGLIAGEPMNNQGRVIRMYSAAQAQAGGTFTVTITPAKQGAAPAGGGADASGQDGAPVSNDAAKWLAGGGAALITVTGASLFLKRARHKGHVKAAAV
jgi:hypothetical protein